MSDFDMVRLCADAMGFEYVGWSLLMPPPSPAGIAAWRNKEDAHPPFNYDPLHDDAQAMALVKKFELNIGQLSGGCKVFTSLAKFTNGGFYEADSKDLNRAIVECVAKIQASKT